MQYLINPFREVDREPYVTAVLNSDKSSHRSDVWMPMQISDPFVAIVPTTLAHRKYELTLSVARCNRFPRRCINQSALEIPLLYL